MTDHVNDKLDSSSDSDSEQTSSTTSKEVKPFVCGGKCGKANCTRAYATKPGLSEHVKGNDAAKHPCTQCNKRFRRSALLENHVRSVHTKDKSFACPNCGKGFSVAFNRDRHVATIHASTDTAVDKKKEEATKSPDVATTVPVEAPNKSQDSVSSTIEATDASPKKINEATPETTPKKTIEMAPKQKKTALPTAVGCLLERAVDLERIPRDDDGKYEEIAVAPRDKIVLIRVGSLVQPVPSEQYSSMTCGYYARYSLECWQKEATRQAAETLLTMAADVRTNDTKTRTRWRSVPSTARMRAPMRMLRGHLSSHRDDFVQKYESWLSNHAMRFDAIVESIDDEEERQTLDLFEMTTRQVATLWPEVTILALGNDGDAEMDVEGVAAAVNDTLPNHARDIERIRRVGETTMLMGVDGTHWVAVAMHRYKDGWIHAVGTDSLDDCRVLKDVLVKCNKF